MYQEIIDRVITERDDARQSERGSDAGEWHPSSLTGCLRQAVYSYTGEAPSNERETRSVRIMDRGTEVHELLQEWTMAAIPGYLPEVSVDYGGVKGSCDGLVPVSDGVEPNDSGVLTPVYELQEYKSISPNGKRFLKGKPKPEHAKQARIYYACLQKQGYLLDGIRITYIDRDDWSATEFEVEPWTPTEENVELWDMVDDLYTHVAEGTLPEQMPDDYWLCRYCEYRTTCKGIA